MAISRREWLKRTGAATAAASLAGFGAGCGDDGGNDALPNRADEHATPALETYEFTGTPGPENLFQHGVASGDPLPNAVVIWTRVTAGAAGPVDVWYEVAIDAAFERRVAAGWLVADAPTDYTVKHDVTGLVPSSTLYYRFKALGRTSPIGRMRTAPEGSIGHLRFGMVSCSSYADGYFHVYRNLAARPDLEAVIHLGDYIYEYGAGVFGSDVRVYEPANEIITLSDYRTRYSQYRRDPDLQELHRQHSTIHVWDDHEVANDSWLEGAENHDPMTEGAFTDRKAAAIKAYSEWMPIRAPEPDPLYRKLAYGDLLDLVMLDTRHEGRSEQLASVADDDETRTLLGFEQETWLATQLETSTARWKFLGQQVMMGRVEVFGGPVALFMDSWDGYPLARTRLLSQIIEKGISNVVVLTGDIHSSWANEVALDPYDPAVYDPATGEGAVAVEFVTPAVSSPGIDVGSFLNFVRDQNPHVQWVDTVQRGCILLDVQRGSVQADWYHVDDVTDPAGGGETFVKAFAVFSGDPKLVEVTEPMPTRAAPPLAP